MIDTFDSHVYSEETYPTTEREHDEVMQAAAVEAVGTDNYIVRGGKVYHKPEPPSLGRLGGFEL